MLRHETSTIPDTREVWFKIPWIIPQTSPVPDPSYLLSCTTDSFLLETSQSFLDDGALIFLPFFSSYNSRCPSSSTSFIDCLASWQPVLQVSDSTTHLFIWKTRQMVMFLVRKRKEEQMGRRKGRNKRRRYLFFLEQILFLPCRPSHLVTMAGIQERCESTNSFKLTYLAWGTV